MSLEVLGTRLKQTRLEKGLSLEEVQKKTKVHINILKAIEGDSLTNLSPIYLKGFLKIYCKFLGVDAKEYLSDYKDPEPLSVGVPKTTTFVTRNKPVKSPPPSFFKNAGIKLGSLRPNKRIKTVFIFVLIVIILGVVLFNLGKFISSKHKAVVIPVSRMETRIKLAPKQKVLVAFQKPKADGLKITKEASGGIILVISARENCLVFVKSDGRVVFHRVLEKGRSESWKAKEKIELTLGNAAAVELTVNGQRFSRLGRKGQPLRNVVITEKDGLRIPR
ncbi:MAG: DUF4115 domain-containing protein [Candidatus Omnitrophica bacterium]|nr:DUF4115 domain-containing protein [Candidatus Omnitrophota bacterium]